MSCQIFPAYSSCAAEQEAATDKDSSRTRAGVEAAKRLVDSLRMARK